MIMDRTTEFISHFFGVFHLAVEEQRLRDVYDKTHHLRLEEHDHGPLLNVTIKVSAPYSIQDVNPLLDYQPTAPATPPVLIYFTPPPFIYFPYPVFTDVPLPLGFGLSLAQPMIMAEPSFLLEPASSILTVTYQMNVLDDDDLLVMSAEAEFADQAEAEQAFEDLQTVAAALSGPGLHSLPDFSEDSDGVADHAEALKTAMEAFTAPDLEGVEATVLKGEDAKGFFSDGEAIEELADIQDLMPAFFPEPETDEDDTETEDEDDSEDGDGDETGDEDGSDDDTAETPDPEDLPEEFDLLPNDPWLDQFDVDPGHAVVTGGNLMVNEVYTGSSWIDAPVIAVMGDVTRLDSISQINVVMDHDTILGAENAGADTNAVNQAQIEYVSSAELAAEQAAEAAEEAGEDPPDEAAQPVAMAGLPDYWVVTEVVGDLVCVHSVEQYNFATDQDLAQVTLSGWDTYIALGENQLVNAQSLVEIGYGYDLIMVGGSMISMTELTQTNVLLDNDMVSYTGMPPTAIDGADNLLLNSASLYTVGVDEYVEMDQDFANAINALEGGADDIDETVAQDALFTGTEILTVLYISGDLTILNSVEQTNILGDADQVQMALDDFANVTGGEITVTTGSNALINAAAIETYGIDSTVMVGGDTYEDALIYQAGMIDTAADPTGVTLNQLANEAVAFLAEGMLDPETGIPEEDTPLTGAIDDGTTPVDVMQTMLA